MPAPALLIARPRRAVLGRDVARVQGLVEGEEELHDGSILVLLRGQLDLREPLAPRILSPLA